MYLSARQIATSIANLKKRVHPFYGITFLVCKKQNLPVGYMRVFALDAQTDRFMREHHRIDPRSDYFFQPFNSTKLWVRPDYPASGLQAINTQTFAFVFEHPSGSREWGWQSDYIEKLQQDLNRRKRKMLPAFDMAVWLYRDAEWKDGVSADEIVNRFLADFQINEQEKVALFDVNTPIPSFDANNFQQIRASSREVLSELTLLLNISSAPDVGRDQGGTLAYLQTRRFGPAQEFDFAPGKRLNIITGDNGLGKTFLLDTVWWTLTGTWAEYPLHPGTEQVISSEPVPVEITFQIEGEESVLPKTMIRYDWKSLSWPMEERPVVAALIIYARVDGSYALWDPIVHITPDNKKLSLSWDEVWGNVPSGRIEGLIRDWVRWQSNPQRYPFETFIKVLERLKPPEFSVFKPGEPVRIPGGDKRDIPTIIHPYGTIPVLYASAGVRRIVTLAYLIVWAWHEHVLAAEMSGVLPQRRMVVLIDELEAHLHPFWQREILPALIDITSMLEEMLKNTTQVQYILSTHSPMVMTSAETVFTKELDKLFHLNLLASGEVVLNPMDFCRYGDASAWLTSPVFDLLHARSKDAENAIESAKTLQLAQDASTDEVRDVTQRLLKSLAQDDYFWPRWIVFAERHGVKV